MPAEPKTGQRSDKEHVSRIKRFMLKYKLEQRYRDVDLEPQRRPDGERGAHEGWRRAAWRMMPVVFIHSHGGGFKLAASSKR